MKRALAIITLCAALGGAAFADIEFSANLGLTPYSGVNVNKAINLKSATSGEEDFSLALSRGFGLGLDVNAAILFWQPVDWFEFGIKAGAGFDGFIGGIEYIKVNTRNYTLSPFAFKLYVNAGPEVRFNIGDRHSVFLAPVLKGTFIGGSEFAAGIDLGYRLWLKNTDSYKTGLAIGAFLGFPIVGRDNFTNDTETWTRSLDYAGGFNVKIFVGAVFNLGDGRTSDSKAAEEEAARLAAQQAAEEEAARNAGGSPNGTGRSAEEEANLDALFKT